MPVPGPTCSVGLGISSSTSPPSRISQSLPTPTPINSLHLYFQHNDEPPYFSSSSKDPYSLTSKHPFDPTFSPPYRDYPLESSTSTPPSSLCESSLDPFLFDPPESDLQVHDLFSPSPSTSSSPPSPTLSDVKDLYRLPEDDQDDAFLLSLPSFDPHPPQEEDDPRFVDLRLLRRPSPSRKIARGATRKDELRLVALGISNAKRTGRGYWGNNTGFDF